jgi:hypothetical protein
VSAVSETSADQIAADFEAANDEVISFADTCTDDQWSTMVSGEEWPVGVVVHHIAVGHQQMIDWLGHVRRGEEITKTASDIDADNDRHAHDFAGVSRADTIEELRDRGAALAQYIRGLRPTELAITVPFGPGNGMAVTAEQLAPISASHCRGHLADARRALQSGTT